jgi:hypothetical protein
MKRMSKITIWFSRDLRGDNVGGRETRNDGDVWIAIVLLLGSLNAIVGNILMLAAAIRLSFSNRGGCPPVGLRSTIGPEAQEEVGGALWKGKPMKIN